MRSKSRGGGLQWQQQVHRSTGNAFICLRRLVEHLMRAATELNLVRCEAHRRGEEVEEGVLKEVRVGR